MMQAADLRNGDHLSDPGWHDRARVRTILVERKMRPGSMIVIDIRGQDAAQMALVEDQDVIQTYMDPASAQGCLSMLKIGCSHISGLLSG